MNWPHFVAQLDEAKPWFKYGLEAAIIFFLMYRVDARLSKITHQLVGVQRCLLIELLSREGLSIAAKTLAKEQLEKVGGHPGSNSPFK